MDDAQVESNIRRQANSVAEQLEIQPGSVFPISAHKGLLGQGAQRW